MSGKKIENDYDRALGMVVSLRGIDRDTILNVNKDGGVSENLRAILSAYRDRSPLVKYETLEHFSDCYPEIIQSGAELLYNNNTRYADNNFSSLVLSSDQNILVDVPTCIGTDWVYCNLVPRLKKAGYLTQVIDFENTIAEEGHIFQVWVKKSEVKELKDRLAIAESKLLKIKGVFEYAA